MALRLLKSLSDDPDYPEWSSPDAKETDRLFAVYARISDAGEEGAHRQEIPGIERQVEDCTKLAKALGARRIRFYREGGSAFSEKRDRRAFTRLIADIRQGDISDVVAWRTERLARRHNDLEELIDASGSDGHDPVTVIRTCDQVNSDTEMGRFVLRQLVSFGRWESVSIGNRVRRARDAERMEGRFSGSPPAFGHKDKTRWRETVPDEVALIREGAARLIAREGVQSILRDLNTRGSRTRSGAMWQHGAFIKMLSSARMVGGRMVGTELKIGGDAKGIPYIAPILDVETWENVRAILADPARRVHAHGGTPRHLLTNLMRCGAKRADGTLCDKRLSAKGQMNHKAGDDYWTYGCVRDSFRPDNCGKVWIRGDHTDAYIEDLVLTYLRKPAIRRALLMRLGDTKDPDKEQAHLRARRIVLVEAIEEREMAYTRSQVAFEAEHHISAKTYLRWREEALAERDDLDRRIAQSERARSVIAATANPIDFWGQATLSSRRDLISSLFPSIRVFSVRDTPGASARRWDPRRIVAPPIA